MNRKGRYILFISLLLNYFTGLAQDNCNQEISKKVQKLLNEATGSSGLVMDERRAVLKQSLEIDPNCLACRFSLARAEYQIAVDRNGSYEQALDQFEKVIEQCPAYHADAHYYAGLIYYSGQDYKEALQAFEGFLNFDAANGKVSRDQSIKEKDVRDIVPEVKFYVDFYANPVAFNPVLLGGVNSAADEYLPMLSPDNELIFFTRKENIREMGSVYTREVELFMEARQTEDPNFYKDSKPLPPPFNVGDNYGGVSLSLDNREMFVTVCQPVTERYKNCDIYVTNYERSKDVSGREVLNWSGLTNLGPAVNTEGWEAQPTLSADGNTLYFSTVREGSTNDADGNPTIDIYYSTRIGKGQWTAAKSLGKPINTSGNDKSPFLHADSRTMYFSSNGRIGAGGYDIYYCKQTDDGTWTDPVNLGYPINSKQDEHGLVVSTDGSRAFFASSNMESAKGLDVFSFEVPKTARPDKVLILKGLVTDDTGNPVSDAKVQLKYAESKKVEEIAVNAEDGSYAALVNLSKGEPVVFSVSSKSHPTAFNSRVFTLEDTLHVVQQASVALDEMHTGATYSLNDIRFATNSSDLNDASKNVLNDFAGFLAENSSLRIQIAGHTDDVGDSKLNLILSTDRAFEVFGYLQDIGVDPRRMTFKGYGDTKPLLPNTTESNRSKNRRTEFKVVGQ